ncbi:MAG: iron-sulfur cluster assembly scaffold protein [Elusimicrobia bacterium]|nr:iron-sulfur cluster assembly scaffold protein [Elusimicrobiota bacterium]
MNKNFKKSDKGFQKALNSWAATALENMGVVREGVNNFEEIRNMVIAGWLKKYSETALRCFMMRKNYGSIDKPDGFGRITGPCGDTMEFYIKVGLGKIKKINFTTDGCESSVACGEMAADILTGKSIASAMKIKKDDVLKKMGRFPSDSRHCALLSVNTAKAAIKDYREKKNDKG